MRTRRKTTTTTATTTTTTTTTHLSLVPLADEQNVRILSVINELTIRVQEGCGVRSFHLLIETKDSEKPF